MVEQRCQKNQKEILDTTAPILSEVTAVTTPSKDSTTNYTFS